MAIATGCNGADGQSVLAGGGEMGERMRAFAWEETSLGRSEDWPQGLKTAVRIMLTSRQPMFVWWGAELINLYNDPYKAIVGGKHPDALGMQAAELWKEIWDEIGPRAHFTITRNEGTYDEALLLIMERNGYREETYYTFSYSPIPDDSGNPGGIICANTDDTARIINERQIDTLRDLAAVTARSWTYKEACGLSAACLGKNAKDIPFAALYLLDADKKKLTREGGVRIEGCQALFPLRVLPDESFNWPFGAAMKSGSIVIVDNLERFGALPTGFWNEPVKQAAIIPIISSAQTGKSGFLVLGLNPYRLFDDNYRGFVELMASSIAASIANAQAFEDERKRAEGLAEIDRAKTAFFSNVSHEFRTPLTLMLGPIEDMLSDADVQGAARELALVAYRNAQRLLKLVNTLLDFSRIEAGRMTASFEPVDLAAYTADLASVFRSAIEKAGLEYRVDCRLPQGDIYVDCDMWEKIVLNLLSNAFKFTLKGSIQVTMQDAGGHVALHVDDTGSGIPADDLPHLFKRFHRVTGSEGRSFEGSGIGLALVRDLVHLHGGTATVASTLAQGTRFTITIPKGFAHLPAEQISEARHSGEPRRKAIVFTDEASRWMREEPALPEAWPAQAVAGLPTVLLVDDNADMRDYVGRLLSASYQVLMAGNGREALSAIGEKIPDLVLTDVMMPEMNGFELLAHLRADPRTAGVPVIMLSARAGVEASAEGIGAGADDYLVKPFTARELLARVGTTIALYRARNQVQAKLSLALESAQMFAWDLDVLTRTVICSPNAARFFGMASGPQAAFMEYIHPEDRMWVEAQFEQAMVDGQPVGIEFRILRADGGIRWLETKGNVTRDGQGKVVSISGVSSDVSVRKTLEESLRESDRRKDEFLAMLAHELRNPLAPIRNGLHILDSPQSSPSMMAQAKEMMGRQVTQLVRLVDDLLDVSRITCGKIELRPEKMALGDIVRMAVETARPLIEQSGHRLEIILPEEQLYLHVDPTRMSQVLSNLLNNAAKYTERGGVVTLEAGRDGQEIYVRVRDTGIGIDAEMLLKIFDLFIQANHSLDRAQGGLGIGLTLARNLVALQGGTLLVSSEGAGKGSLFTVRLPLAAIGEDAAGAEETEVKGAPGGRRVIVVDDNVESAKTMGWMVELLGHEVQIAHDGPEALRLAGEFRPDVMLLDIGLPGMNGFELCAALKKNPLLAHTRFIAQTGWGQEEHRRRSQEAGFDHHLVKPVDMNELQSLLAA